MNALSSIRRPFIRCGTTTQLGWRLPRAFDEALMKAPIAAQLPADARVVARRTLSPSPKQAVTTEVLRGAKSGQYFARVTHLVDGTLQVSLRGPVAFSGRVS